MKNVLILGASGLIGTVLYEKLAEREEYHVFGARRLTGASDREDKGTLLYWDMYAEPKDIVFDFSINYDCIVVCAWDGNQRKKRSNLEVNKACADKIYDYLEYICTRCNVNQIILCGSQAEYGAVTETIHENVAVDVDTLSVYGWSKKYLYERLLVAGFSNVLTELRFHSVFGYQKQSEQMILMVLRNLLQQKVVNLSTNCEQRSNFIYVDDVVSAIITAIDCKIDGCFNVGTSQDLTLKEYVLQVGAELNAEHLIEFGTTTTVESGFFCSDKFRVATGWCEKNSFLDGIKKVVLKMSEDVSL